jgi:outer membrane cobalamin receptor
MLLLRHSWISYRYTTEINDRFLPAYSLESAALRYKLPVGPFNASVKAEVNNIFNTSYQVVALYPMPLREVRVTLEAGL